MSQLAQRLLQAHERALTERAADPASRDQAAADRLAQALTGGNATALISSAATPDGVEVVTATGAGAEVGGGLSYEETTLGTCVRTRATSGSPRGGAGERGTVTTEPVVCPDGVVPLVEGHAVAAMTTDLDALRRPVPTPAPQACVSGTGACPGG